MKLYSSPYHGAIHRPSLTHAVANLRSGFGQFVAKFIKGSANFVTQMQIARMQSVLNEMSDAQLAKIGVERRNIRERAEFLVLSTEQPAPHPAPYKEYDGL